MPERHRFESLSSGFLEIPRHGRGTLSRRHVLRGTTAALGALLLPISLTRTAAQDQVIEPLDPTSTEPAANIAADTETPTPSTSQGIVLTSDQLADQSNSQYFAATGHNLTAPFLQPWTDAGGEPVLGSPLSEGRFVDTTGTIQQVFETLTLDYNPTLDPTLAIQGVPLGTAMGNSLASSTQRAAVSGCSGSDASCQFFPDTHHTISGEFASFWTLHGGQLIFGLPVSEPFKKGKVTTQVFERAVFDLEAGGSVTLRKVMVDAVASSSLATDAAYIPAPPTLGKTSLVKAGDGLRLRDAPNETGNVRVVLPDNAEFIAADAGSSPWVPGYVDGYSGWVAVEFLSPPKAVPAVDLKDWDLSVWQGAALGDTYLRAKSTTKAKSVKTLAFGDQVVVTDWVEGEEVFEGANIWAALKDGSFVYARNIGRSAPVAPTPIPADAPASGKWIDVNLTQQLMMAYEDRQVVRTCVTTTGMPGWETPEGSFAINTRVANETMGSGSIGAENFFNLKNVLFTQYFTDVGHAIHFAWWRTKETIGRPGSHGCLNLLLDDSQFFWDWAEIGTPVIVRS